MRQVRRDELIWNIRYQLGRLPDPFRKGLCSREGEVRRRTEDVIAALIVDRRLQRYEILTDNPEGPPCPVISDGTGGAGIGGFED